MSNLSEAVSAGSRAAVWWGVLLLLVGVLAMSAPFATGMAIGLVIGAILLAGGIAQTFYAFQARSFGKGLLRIVFGGVTILAGLYCVAQPGLAAATLGLFIAAYFVVDGVFNLLGALMVEDHRGWLLLNGALSLALGVLLWQGWPLSGVMAIGILLGIRLFFSGLMMIAIAAAGKRASKTIASMKQ